VPRRSKPPHSSEATDIIRRLDVALAGERGSEAVEDLTAKIHGNRWNEIDAEHLKLALFRLCRDSRRNERQAWGGHDSGPVARRALKHLHDALARSRIGPPIEYLII
jgi:hypothetical protein